MNTTSYQAPQGVEAFLKALESDPDTIDINSLEMGVALTLEAASHFPDGVREFCRFQAHLLASLLKARAEQQQQAFNPSIAFAS